MLYRTTYGKDNDIKKINQIIFILRNIIHVIRTYIYIPLSETHRFNLVVESEKFTWLCRVIWIVNCTAIECSRRSPKYHQLTIFRKVCQDSHREGLSYLRVTSRILKYVKASSRIRHIQRLPSARKLWIPPFTATSTDINWIMDATSPADIICIFVALRSCLSAVIDCKFHANTLHHFFSFLSRNTQG